ncbi:MAG: ribosome-associated translation inhibitor RaiA [Pseudomonadota bacterium]
MQISVTFKNIEASDPLKTYVSEKLTKFDRYLHNPADANVVLSVEKHRHLAEITIVGDRMALKGAEETDDMYAAIDMVLDKLEKQIKKGKAKQRERRGAAVRSNTAVTGTHGAAAPDALPQVHLEHIEYKPMDDEEAVLQMDLIDKPFLVFTNARTGLVNVLYRRSDGDYGLIQPRG